MQIRLTVGDCSQGPHAGQRDQPRLSVSAALTLTLGDYAGTEKVSDLPRRLSTEDVPAGVDPAVGDIAYYAPWGNLAIFYGTPATQADWSGSAAWSPASRNWQA